MRYLLDTHTVLWALDNTSRLSEKASKVLKDPKTYCVVSVVSLFGIAIKKKINKLELSHSIKSYTDEIQKTGFHLLPISSQHLDSYEQVPFYENHKDPFDRLLIATAISENLDIVTIDEKFDLYKDIITIIW